MGTRCCVELRTALSPPLLLLRPDLPRSVWTVCLATLSLIEQRPGRSGHQQPSTDLLPYPDTVVMVVAAVDAITARRVLHHAMPCYPSGSWASYRRRNRWPRLFLSVIVASFDLARLGCVPEALWLFRF